MKKITLMAKLRDVPGIGRKAAPVLVTHPRAETVAAVAVLILRRQVTKSIGVLVLVKREEEATARAVHHLHLIPPLPTVLAAMAGRVAGKRSRTADRPIHHIQIELLARRHLPVPLRPTVNQKDMIFTQSPRDANRHALLLEVVNQAAVQVAPDLTLHRRRMSKKDTWKRGEARLILYDL